MNTFTKGMDWDTLPQFKDPSTYNLALNAVIDTLSGDKGALSTEEGNRLCASLPPNTTLIGHTQTDKPFEFILFLHPNIIGIYNSATCTYETLVSAPCLNFPLDQVQAIFKITDGCDRNVYFTDRVNPYRVLNIDNLSSYLGPLARFDCDKIKFSQPFDHPSIAPSISSSGQLLHGQYHFAIRYLDAFSNPTSFSPLSRGVDITPHPITATRRVVKGAVNPVTDPINEIGTAPPSSNSITLTISNIDVDFPFYQVAVIPYTSSNGVPTTPYLLPPTPTSQSTLIVTGHQSEQYASTTLPEILTPLQFVDVVATHATQNSRLYLANLSTTARDFSTFQEYASRIIVSAQSAPLFGVPENPVHDLRLMPNEVYALSVTYILDDGTLSPAFHIPGRPATSQDLTPLLPNDPNNVFSKTQTWQVYDTSANHPTGLSYYQTSTLYSDVLQCGSTKTFFGKDAYGTTLANTPIRHHRIPSTETKLSVSNVTLPPSAVGYYILLSDRTGNETVIDEGVLILPSRETPDSEPTHTYNLCPTNLHTSPTPHKGSGDSLLFCGDNATFMPPSNDFSNVPYIYLSPSTTHLSSIPTGQAIRAGQRYVANSTTYKRATDVSPLVQELVTTLFPQVELFVASTTDAPFSRILYAIEEQAFLPSPPASSVQILDSNFITPFATTVNFTDSSVVNRSPNVNALFLKLDSPLTTLGSWLAATAISSTPFVQKAQIIVDRSPYEDLSSIKYNLTSAPLFTPTADLINFGDTIYTTTNLSDYSFYNPSGTSNYYSKADYLSFPSHSTINTSLRHEDKLKPIKYSQFKTYSPSTSVQAFVDYVASRQIAPTDDVLSTYIYPEQYLYNKDYSYLVYNTPFFSIDIRKDFCSTCTDTFPTRIYYSPPSSEESSQDNFRIIRADSYADVPQSSPIVLLLPHAPHIYALTSSSIYRIQSSPSSLSSSNGQVYLGDPTHLSTPPILLSSTIGIQHPHHHTPTPYGPVFVDTINQRIIHLTDQLNDLSLHNFKSFARQHLSPSLPLPTSIHDPNSLGFSLTYDPFHSRVIISRKDFKPLPQFNYVFDPSTRPNTSTLFYSPSSHQHFFIHPVLGQIPISLSDPNYFEDRSYTLSYSFPTSSFTSFHSYISPHYITTPTTFHSSSPSLYSHDSSTPLQFYDNLYPHIIETTLSHQTPSTLNSIHYLSDTYTSSTSPYEDTTTRLDPEKTFTSALVYNSNQSTHYFPLTYKSPFSQSLQLSWVDRTYHFNNLRDRTLSSALPLFSSYSPFPFPSPSTSNITSNPYQLDRLSDRYHSVRLLFEPTSTPSKISTYHLYGSTTSLTRSL